MAGAALRRPVCCLCRRRTLVFRRVAVAASGAGFAWQGQHFFTLSVVCVAGVLCSGVSRRVPVAVSGAGRGST